MLGAIIGDIVGSPYEFFNVDSKQAVKPFVHTPRGRCHFTDDSALCMAVASALIQSKDEKDETALGDAVARKLQEYCKKYPCRRTFPLPGSCYGDGFLKWIEEGDIHKDRPLVSSNGGAMRATPIGWLYSSLDEIIRVAKVATERTHNSEEAIKSAQMIAAAVFLARRTNEKGVIREYAEQLGYDIPRGESGYDKLREESRRYRLDKLKKFELGKFLNCGAKTSVEAALFAFLDSKDYEDCIRTAIAVGGDSDTIACMAGGIAEAFYDNIPVEWKRKAGEILKKCGCTLDDFDMVMNFRKYAAQ